MTSQRSVALVTGAGRGLGAEIAQTLASEGYSVIATSRSEVQHPGCEWMPLDVSDERDVVRVFEAIKKTHGRLDALINNASAYTSGKWIDEVTEDDIRNELNVTVGGPIRMTSKYMATFRGQGFGRIVFVASTAGLQSEPGCEQASLYSASKAAVIRFSECIQPDLARCGMSSHVLVPANIRDGTDLASLVQEQAVSYREAARHVLGMISVTGNGRVARLELRPASS